MERIRSMYNKTIIRFGFLGVSWRCGHYCLLAFVLWCGYCSVSFQSFVLRHWCPQHQETTGFFDIQNNQGLGKGYQPQPSASADNPYLDLDYS